MHDSLSYLSYDEGHEMITSWPVILLSIPGPSEALCSNAKCTTDLRRVMGPYRKETVRTVAAFLFRLAKVTFEI